MTRVNVKRFVVLAVVVVSTLAHAQPARAVPLLVGDVTVTEFDTGFGNTTDTVAIGSGVGGIEIRQGDGTGIGNTILQTGE